MTFVDKYVKEILQLEVRLFHAKARLEASYDTEALHDLRIAIRRIRSLLVPVRDVHVLDDLREAAAQVGRLTTPARDREVMTDELESRGFRWLPAVVEKRSKPIMPRSWDTLTWQICSRAWINGPRCSGLQSPGMMKLLWPALWSRH